MGELIKKKFGMTREEFADAVGVSKATVDFWCDGHTPSYKDLRRIARAFSLSLQEVKEYCGG